jgi:hypothetical protein
MALLLEHITSDILARAIDEHRVLGPALLESSHQARPAYQLGLNRRRAARQGALPLPPSQSFSPWLPVAIRGECP